MLEELKSYFKKKKDIDLAFLFGSQAKGRGREASDYDVAVWFKKEPAMEDVNKIWNEIADIVHKDVDLIVLNSARPTVAWAALRGKKLLIRDFKLYLRLVLDVSREAEDMQDFAIEFWNLKRKLAQT